MDKSDASAETQLYNASRVSDTAFLASGTHTHTRNK